MKRIPILCFFIVATFSTLLAQENSVEYMENIGKMMDPIKTKTWQYISAIAHGKNAKKVETTRKDLVTAITTARTKVKALPPYKGDAEYRDSTVAYLNLSYIVINEDYSKIVDMEAVAEQSYDAMEAYLLAQELANDKLDVASDNLSKAQKAYAARNNITLTASTDKTEQNLVKAGKVMSYHNTLYLLFYKSFKQDVYLTDALNKTDINAIQQNTSTLQKYAEEGLKRLDTVKSYNGDGSMLYATKEVLKFYLAEAKDKMPVILGYFVKKENFERIKTSIDSKPESKRTQQDIDSYNKAVAEMNAGVKQYNTVNNELNQRRTTLLENWNKSSSAFLDNNIAKQ